MALLDKLIIEADKIIKTILSEPTSRRQHPDEHLEEAPLSEKEKNLSSSLMRVNHCGEVCAQALYQGQALVARDTTYQNKLAHAAFEETEHLAWTKKRITELGGHTSFLNPFFYFSSLAMGVAVGLLGDKWNLAFLEETENQVGAHLDEHLEKLPKDDQKSKAILLKMKADEAKHAEMAHNLGARELPRPVKKLMHLMSQVMKNTTYHI